MKSKTFANYVSCGKCTSILEDGNCALCSSVENANKFLAERLAAASRPVPFVGVIVMIIVATLTMVCFSFCTRTMTQPANKQISIRK